MSEATRCGLCGSPVAVVSSDEGTQHYEPLAVAAVELSQVKEQLDREMDRVEAVRNYALEHIEKGKSGGLVLGNATGRSVVGAQLLEILESHRGGDG